MSSQDEMFARAQKIIEEARGDKTIEGLIDEQLERLKTLDIMAELQSMDRFDEITKELSKDEKAIFDKKAVEIIDEHRDILDVVADTLKDPKAREIILEELKRRVG